MIKKSENKNQEKCLLSLWQAWFRMPKFKRKDLRDAKKRKKKVSYIIKAIGKKEKNNTLYYWWQYDSRRLMKLRMNQETHLLSRLNWLKNSIPNCCLDRFWSWNFGAKFHVWIQTKPYRKISWNYPLKWILYNSNIWSTLMNET